MLLYFVTHSKQNLLHVIWKDCVSNQDPQLMNTVCHDNYTRFLYISIVLSREQDICKFVLQSFLNTMKKTPFWLCIMIDSYCSPNILPTHGTSTVYCIKNDFNALKFLKIFDNFFHPSKLLFKDFVTDFDSNLYLTFTSFVPFTSFKWRNS